MKRGTIAAVTGTLAVTLATGTPAMATSPADDADLIALSVRSGELSLDFRQSGKKAVAPDSMRFTTPDRPVGTIPDDPAFAFLGTAGAPVWSLQDDSPFSTFDTTAVSGGPVTLELAAVQGPGSFAAYTLSEWGRPTPLLDSDGKRSTSLPGGTRTGGVVWAFDSAGDYRVTLRATTRSGSRTLSDEAVYSVSVPGTTAAPQAAAPTSTTSEQAAATGTAIRAQAAAATVISDGHVDMGPQLSGDTMTIKLKDDSTSPPVWRELSEVTLKAVEKSRTSVPAGDAYTFLGKAGDKIYLLPQSQQPGVVWPGWNTQHESMVNGTKGDVVWKLQQVSGPGQVKLYTQDSFGGPKVIFDTAESLPQQLSIPPNTHAHGSWAFTRAGIYKLTNTMTATTTAGRSVSDTKTLTIAVGDSTDTGCEKDCDDTGSGDDGSEDSGSGTGDNDSSDTSGNGDLAKTGMNLVSIAGGGLLLLAAGVAVVVLTRRRQSKPTA